MKNINWTFCIKSLIWSIIIYTLGGIADSIIEAVDSITNPVGFLSSFMDNGGYSSFDIGEFFYENLAKIFVICGYLMFYGNLKKFAQLQTNPSDTQLAKKICTGYVFLFVAIIVKIIPVIGNIAALVLIIIAYVKILSGYKGLSISQFYTDEAQRGAALLHTSTIWTLVAGIIDIIPVVGGFIAAVINCIVFFYILKGWKHIMNGAPESEEGELGIAVNPALGNLISKVPGFSELASVNAANKQMQVFEKDDEELHQIVESANIYNPALVEACKQELKIRQEMPDILPGVEDKSDEELRAILSSPNEYNPAFLRCCQQVNDKRVKQEQERKALVEKEKREKEKCEREQRLLEQAEKQKAFWKKWRIVIIASVAFLIGLITVLGITSDRSRYVRAMKNSENPQEASALLSKIKNPKSDYYFQAKFHLGVYKYYTGDTLGAKEAFGEAAGAINWNDPNITRWYCQLATTGEFAPAIVKNTNKAADIYSQSVFEEDKVEAAALYYHNYDYEKCYNIVKQYSYNRKARAYLGLLTLYGLAGLEVSAMKAFEYLWESDCSDPEVYATTADLMIYLNNGDNPNSTSYRFTHEDVISKYINAMSISGGNPKYKMRYEIAEKYFAVKDIYNNLSWGQNDDLRSMGKTYWADYNLTSGWYTGEAKQEGGWFTGKKGANGWGHMKLNSGDDYFGQIQGYYHIVQGSAFHFNDSDNSYTLEFGEFDNGKLVDGYQIINGKYKKVN